MQGHPSHLELRERTATGELLGPTPFVAGPALDKGLVPDKAAAERVVREHKATGYDLVKVMDPGAELYESIAKTAKEVGIPFGGHVPRGIGLRRAIQAGQRSVAHLDGYIEAAEADNSPIQNSDFLTRARELPFHTDVGKMAELPVETQENGVWNSPTLAL